MPYVINISWNTKPLPAAANLCLNVSVTLSCNFSFHRQVLQRSDATSSTAWPALLPTYGQCMGHSEAFRRGLLRERASHHTFLWSSPQKEQNKNVKSLCLRKPEPAKASGPRAQAHAQDNF